MPNVIVLETDSKQMIGFLLFSSDKPIFTDLGWEGDCIFTGVPKDPIVFENALCEYLQDNKNVEFSAKITSTNKGYSLTINKLLSAELSQSLEGTWWPIDKEMKGCCFVLRE
ncbi:hypothetical protein [Enterovibrio norvegicus]|uniref:hypothetical protein n=1 Tax=Enterovibrio norvegicus TaxID=188144 RepID=UPI000C81B8F3|nr:hypothetical protein [Enterovibrio norvegicus]PMN61451.1 hypothetical protein BCT27_25040 [Enterovibrio norvegicus]